jgi:hypothetical protein
MPLGAAILLVLAALVAAFLVWFLLLRGDDDDDAGGPQGPVLEKTVEIVTVNDLRVTAAAAGHTVYWVGQRPGVDYELTEISDGRIYVRYLPEGEQPESGNPYLTVGSYAQANAYEVLQRLGNRPGAETARLPGGGLALGAGDSPGIYVAFPGQETQIEVFHPQTGRALDLAESGALTPVG